MGMQGWKIAKRRKEITSVSKGNGEEKREGPRSEQEAPTMGGHVLNEFQEFLEWKASKVLDKAVDMALEEIASKVMEEEDDTLGHVVDTQVDIDTEFQGEVEGEVEMEVEYTQILA